METFGILFSIPGAFIASAIYRILLITAATRWRWIRPIFLTASWLVLGGGGAECTLLTVHGAIGTRSLVGPAYYQAHLLVFVLGTPALVNVMILNDVSRRTRWWV